MARTQYRSTTGMTLTDDDNAETVTNCADFIRQDLRLLRFVWGVIVLVMLFVMVMLLISINDFYGVVKWLGASIIFFVCLLFYPNVIVETDYDNTRK